jgi:hypothetical protein
MRDCLYRFSRDGVAECLVKGFARPQGMAFLPDGNLLIATGYQGKKGIFQYSPKNESIAHYITAPILVGLAITGHSMYLASNDSIYQSSIGSHQ